MRYTRGMWQKFLLAIVLGVVVWQSRLGPNQWLLGWDSLVPELNWQANFQRALAGAWQEYQGVGLPGGMAHLADLPRMAILWVIDLVLPANYVRWSWHVLMLIIGPIGVWYWGKRWGKWSEDAGLVASLFYLLNLATVQYFFVPYEAFSSFYGFLPWIVGSYLTYLESGQKKDLGRLVLVSILSTSAFYVQTLFVVILMLLGILTLSYWREWKRVIKAGWVMLATNAFWLLPVAYGVMQGGTLVGAAKINSIGSPETTLMNAALGGWENVLVLRGYWLEWVEWLGESSWGRMMEGWWGWSGSVWAMGVAWGIFGVSVVGLVVGVLIKRVKWGWIGGLLLGCLMMASFTQPFGLIYSWLVEQVPLFGEMFRSVFTKWSVVLAFLISVGLGSLVTSIRNKWVSGLAALILIVGVGLTVWPVFRGGVFFDKMKVELPNEYLKLFKYMGGQDRSGRFAYLPAQDMWSWKYNEWGYRGSGFFWYGIEQPILDRAFDVWSPYNEGFYNQISTVLYGCESGQSQIPNPPAGRAGSPILKLRCEEQVARVLQKYDVRYVLLDESVIAPGQGKEILRIEETKKLASELGWEQKFQEGRLTVWEVPQSHSDTVTQYVSAPKEYLWVEADTRKVREDVVAWEVGHYVSAVTQPHSDTVSRVTYPFAGLMREETKGVEWGDGNVKSVTQLNSDTVSQLIIPGWERGEWVEMGYEMRIEDNRLQVDWEPVYRVGEQEGPRLEASSWKLVAGGGYWVKIGENETKYISGVEKVRGRAKLQVGEEIPVKIYDGKGRIAKVTVGDEQKCGEKGELSCWATPLEKATSDSLLQTITHYEGAISPEVCLDLEGEPYECVNRVKRGESPIVVTTAVAKGERYWLDWVARDSGTQMKEPGVVWYGLVDELKMTSDMWEQFLRERNFALQGQALPAQADLKVEVAGESTDFDFAKLGKATLNNCDVLGRGRAEKVVTSDTVTQYTADERGAACDYVEMSELDTRLPYLLRLTGENIEGRSIKLFLWNSGNKRNDIEYLLGKNKFDQTFALLPWEFAGAYSLNIETRSFGQYAENVLAPVEVIYFPLKQIAGAKIITNQQVSNSPIGNELRITNVKKTGTWLYRVKVEPADDKAMAGEGGLLRLSQGYDKGWVAMTVPQEHGDTVTRLKHVKVDGWSNGWLVEANPPSPVASDGHGGWVVEDQFSNPQFSNSQIIIFYWPQLLEYLGFGLLAVTVIVVWKRN